MKRRRIESTKVHAVAGRNCSTLHVVPRELTETRLKALMDAVYMHGTRDRRSLGWLAASGYVDIVDGSAYVCRWALPLVRAIKAQGFYYWAGAQEPNHVTADGRRVSGWQAFAAVQADAAGLAEMQETLADGFYVDGREMAHAEMAARTYPQAPNHKPDPNAPLNVQ